MVDIQLFAQSEKIEEALRNHSCKECLAWCSENRSSLRKMKVRKLFFCKKKEKKKGKFKCNLYRVH